MGWIYGARPEGRSAAQARDRPLPQHMNLPARWASCLFSRPPGWQQAGRANLHGRPSPPAWPARPEEQLEGSLRWGAAAPAHPLETGSCQPQTPSRAPAPQLVMERKPWHRLAMPWPCRSRVGVPTRPAHRQDPKSHVSGAVWEGLRVAVYFIRVWRWAEQNWLCHQTPVPHAGHCPSVWPARFSFLRRG